MDYLIRYTAGERNYVGVKAWQKGGFCLGRVVSVKVIVGKIKTNPAVAGISAASMQRSRSYDGDIAAVGFKDISVNNYIAPAL